MLEIFEPIAILTSRLLVFDFVKLRQVTSQMHGIIWIDHVHNFRLRICLILLGTKQCQMGKMHWSVSPNFC